MMRNLLEDESTQHDYTVNPWRLIAMLLIMGYVCGCWYGIFWVAAAILKALR